MTHDGSETGIGTDIAVTAPEIQGGMGAPGHCPGLHLRHRIMLSDRETQVDACVIHA